MNSIDKKHLIRKIEKYNLEDLLKEQNQTSFPKVKKTFHSGNDQKQST